MTNEELKKKIVEALNTVQDFGFKSLVTYYHDKTSTGSEIGNNVSNDNVANALIAAGIGDIEATTLRAEVAESELERYTALIKPLEAENAALHERLSKAVELPILQIRVGTKMPVELIWRDEKGCIRISAYRRWEKDRAIARLEELKGWQE